MSKIKQLKFGRSESVVLAQVLEAASMLGLDISRQNTGGFTNPRGQFVACGQPGNSDLIGVLKDGRAVMIECKHENFDPSKLRGAKRDHFERQLQRLRKTNALGGVAFVVTDVAEFLTVMRIVLRGGWVEERGEGGLTVYDPEIRS